MEIPTICKIIQYQIVKVTMVTTHPYEVPPIWCPLELYFTFVNIAKYWGVSQVCTFNLPF